MNTGKKLTKIFSLMAVMALALAVVGARRASWVQAHDDDGDPEGIVSFPLTSAGLVFGESLRTILINRGSRPLSVQVSTFDADGSVVKQETLVLQPGRTRAFEVRREEEVDIDSAQALSSSTRGSVPLRTEVAVRRAHARDLWTASEVIDNETGSTKYEVNRIALNHNETLVRDTSPMK